jgi:hypothetical protein
LFAEELGEAERHLSTAPESGATYGYRRNRLIRRWLLPTTEYHVYFSVDRKGRTVTVHSVWGARRGRGPRL